MLCPSVLRLYRLFTPNCSLCVPSFALHAILHPVSVRQNTNTTQYFDYYYCTVFYLILTSYHGIPAVESQLHYLQAPMFIDFFCRVITSHRLCHCPATLFYSFLFANLLGESLPASRPRCLMLTLLHLHRIMIISHVHLDPMDSFPFTKQQHASLVVLMIYIYITTSHIQIPSSPRPSHSKHRTDVPRNTAMQLAQNFHNRYNCTNVGNLPQNSSGSSLIGTLSIPC